MSFFDIVFVGGGALLHFGVIGQVGHLNRVRLDLPHGLRNQREINLWAVQQSINLIHFRPHVCDHLGITRFGVQWLGGFGHRFQHVKTGIKDFKFKPQILGIHLRCIFQLFDQRIKLGQLDGEFGDRPGVIFLSAGNSIQPFL